MSIDISGTPYYLPDDTGSRAFEETLRSLSERVERLRSQGKLSKATRSRSQAAAPPLLRATVLHAWLEYIHPFVDGNGRAGRAVTNLELIRAEYPHVIVRRKDQDSYLDSLMRADQRDLGDFLDLMARCLEDALRDLDGEGAFESPPWTRPGLLEASRDRRS